MPLKLSLNNKLRPDDEPAVVPQAPASYNASTATNALKDLLRVEKSPAGWSQDAEPTQGEVLARIATISQEDDAKGFRAWTGFQQFRDDPSTSLYEPYSKPTNPAVEKMLELGYDLSGGVTTQWLTDNAQLAQGSTADAYAALLEAAPRTDKADEEWAALQQEAWYWLNRTDRNYTLEQALEKVDWERYPTLKAMDDDREAGNPTILNRPVGYNQDALSGLDWSSRNVSTGDPLMDSVNAALGRGNTWQENVEITSRLDPDGVYYSPYSLGSTLDDAACYFYVQSFGKNWLEENRDILEGDDETAIAMYHQVEAAEANTSAAESEIEQLYNDINARLGYTTDPDTILYGLQGKYPTLARMDESLSTGDLVPTTRAINYSWKEVQDTVQAYCDKANSVVQGSDFVDEVGKTLLATVPLSDSDKAVYQARQKALADSATTIMENGTEWEKAVFQAGANYSIRVQGLVQSISNGQASTQEVYNASYDLANQFATDDGWYLEAKRITQMYDAKMAEYAQQKASYDKWVEGSAQAEDEMLGIARNAWVYDDGGTHYFTTADGNPGVYQNGMQTLQISTENGESGTIYQYQFDKKSGSYVLTRFHDNATGKTTEVPEDDYQAHFTGNVILARALGGNPITQAPADAAENARAELLLRYDELNAYLYGDGRVAMPTVPGKPAGYDEARQKLEYLNDLYAAADRIADLSGADTSGNVSARGMMDVIYTFGSEAPQMYYVVDAYNAAIEQGYGMEEVLEYARYCVEQYQDAMEMIPKAYSWAVGGQVGIDQAYIDNMMAYFTWANNNIKDAEYFLLRENEDFASVVRDTKAGIHIDTSIHIGTSTKDFLYYVAHPEADFTSPAQPMNEMDRDTFLYLYGTEGIDAAMGYFDHLNDPEYGVLHTRSAAQMQENAEAFANAHPYLATYGSILMAPVNSAAGLYAAIEGYNGRTINPYSPYFSTIITSNAIRSTVKDNISKALGDYAILGELGYDAVTAAGDSAANALLFRGFGLGATATAAVTSANMALGAGGGTVQNALMNGISQDKALKLGVIDAAAEFVTELPVVENLSKAMLGGKAASKLGILAALGQNSAAEGVGEGLSAAISKAGEAFVTGQYDEWKKNVPQMGEVEATTRFVLNVLKENGGEIGYEALVGTVSGGMSEAASIALGTGQRITNREALPAALQTVPQVAQNITAPSVDSLAQATVENQLPSKPKDIRAMLQTGIDSSTEGATHDLMTASLAELSNKDIMQIVRDSFAIGSSNQQIVQNLLAQAMNRYATGERSSSLVYTPRKNSLLNSATPAGAEMRSEAPAQSPTQNVEGEPVDASALLLHGLTMEKYDAAAQAAQGIYVLRADTTISKAISKGNVKALRGLVKDVIDAQVQGESAALLKKAVDTMPKKSILKELSSRADLVGFTVETGYTSEKDVNSFADGLVVKNIIQAAMNIYATGQRYSFARYIYEDMQEVIPDEQVTETAEASEEAPVEPEETLQPEAENAPAEVEAPAEAVSEAPAQGAQQEPDRAAVETEQERQETIRTTVKEASALQKALTTRNNANIMAALAAALSNQENSETAGEQMGDVMAQAAAFGLTEKLLSSETAAGLVLSVTIAAAEGDIRMERVKNAIKLAAMSDGQSAMALDQIIQQGRITPETLKLLSVAAEVDAGDAAVNAQVDAAITNALVSQREMALIEDGALEGISGYELSMQKAEQRVRHGEEALKQAQTSFRVKAQALQNAQAQFSQEPTDQERQGGLQRAIKDVQGAAIVVNQQQQSLTNAQEDAQAVLGTLAEKTNSAMRKIREQAVDEVAKIREREAEQNAKKTDSVSIQHSRSLGDTSSAAQPITSASVKSADAIRRELDEAIGLSSDPRLKKYERDLRNTTRGYTTRINGRTTGIVHIQDASNIETVAHEYGHVFDALFGFVDKAPIQQMEAFIQNDPARSEWFDQYTAEEKPLEALAEFMRYWLLDRNTAVRMAGEQFTSLWEKTLNDSGYLRPLQQAALDYRINRAADATEKAKASVALEEPKMKTSISERWETLRKNLVDYTAPLVDMELAGKRQAASDGSSFQSSLDPRNLLLAKENAIASFTRSILYEDMVDPEGNIVYYEDGSKVGSYQDVLNQVKQKDEHDFLTYWVAKHNEARVQQNKPLLDSSIDTDAVIRDMEAEHPDWPQILADNIRFYERFMQVWGVDTGVIDQNVLDTMRAMYPYYAPSFRVGQTRGGNVDAASPGNGLKKARGSTADIYNPVMSIVEYIQRRVADYKQIEALRAFDSTMRNVAGLEGIAEPVQKDVTRDDRKGANEAAREAVRQAIEKLRQDWATLTADQENAIMDAVDGLKDAAWYEKDTATGNDVLNIPMQDGSIHSWTVYDKGVFDALTAQPKGTMGKVQRTLSRISRIITGALTSFNPFFAGQNVFSDSETAMATGNAARTPVGMALQQLATGANQAVNRFIDAMPDDLAAKLEANKSIAKMRETWRRYKLFGQMGSRYAFRSTETQRETRRKLFKSDKPHALRLASAIAKAPLSAVEFFADFLETNTRYNELLHGGHDLSTYSGSLDAGRAAREVTVDFSKHGSSELVTGLRSVFIFLNSSLQGIDKTMRLFSRENEGHRAQIATRLIVSTALVQVALAVIRNITWNDEEKEAYDLLTNYERTKYEHIKLGDGTFLRFKRSQDALVQFGDALGEFLGDMLFGAEPSSEMGQLYGSLEEIIANFIYTPESPLKAFSDAANNKNWYGGDIENYRMQQLPVVSRYEADTPMIYRSLSSLLSLLGIPDANNYSPLDIQYIVNQTFGPYGEMLTSMMSLCMEGDLTVDSAAYVVSSYAAKKFAVDPVYSNNLSTVFYDGKTKMDEMIQEASKGTPSSTLRNDLTKDEAAQAVAEAKALWKSDGRLGRLYDSINGLWNRHDEILADRTLTNEVKELNAREVREEINDAYMEANAIMEAYWEKWGYESDMARRVNNFAATLGLASQVEAPDSTDIGVYMLPQAFLDDKDQPYMTKAIEVYQATGKTSAMPHPNTGYDSQKVTYSISDNDWDEWVSAYKDAYIASLEKNAANWDTLTDKEKLQLLTDAHSDGHNAAKKWHKEKYDIK